MMRTVSKEDCLLGRGANPRTGLITPGGSVDSNIGEIYETSRTNTTPSAKWRQKGDEWVSLNVMQPMSAPDFDVEECLTMVQSRRQTPPRFSDHNSSLLAHASASHKRLHVRGTTPLGGFEDLSAQNMMGNDHFPGAFPESPTKRPAQKLAKPLSLGAPIRRKPVAASLCQDNLAIKPLQIMQESNQLPFTQQQVKDCGRSFSVPNTEMDAFTAIGAESVVHKSNRPRERKEPLRQADHSYRTEVFLPAIRSRTLPDLQQSLACNRESSVMNLDKDLPSLPTNSCSVAQSRSEYNLQGSEGSAGSGTSKVNGSHQQDQSSMRTGSNHNNRSHIANMICPLVRSGEKELADRSVSQGICKVPNYDNPPQLSIPKQRRPPLAGPRDMPRPSRQKVQMKPFKSMHDDPFITTNINHDIAMLSLAPRRQHQMFDIHNLPECQPPPSIPLPPTPRPKTSPRYRSTPNGTTVANVSTTVKTPTRIRHSARSYPHIPLGTDSGRQIPRAGPLNSIDSKTQPEAGVELNAVGMQTMANEILVKQEPVIRVKPLAELDGSQTAQRDPVHVTPRIAEPGQSSEINAKRRCSRCHNGFVILKPAMRDGLLHTRLLEEPASGSGDISIPNDSHIPSGPTTGVAESTQSGNFSSSAAAVKKTTTFVSRDARDHRDHSACCPDCCQNDCHEGCLGHPSPRSSPNKHVIQPDAKLLLRRDSSSTLISDSGKSSASSKLDEKGPKPSFVKSAFKIPFWSRGNSSLTSRSSNSSLNGTTLGEVDATSPAISNIAEPFHGHDCAVAAAKKAIGCSSPEDRNERQSDQSLVLKRRSNSDKAARGRTCESNVTTALTPPPTPPSSMGGATPNEDGKVIGSHSGGASDSIKELRSPVSRTISGASIDVRLLSMDNMGIAKLAEVLFTNPFEATRMWLHNNPQIVRIGRSALCFGWLMLCVITTTSKLFFNSMYVYSKTGRFRIKDANGKRIEAWQFITDVSRSVVFLLTFATLALFISRLIGIVLLPIRLLVTIGRYLAIGGDGGGNGRKVTSLS